MSKLLVVDDSDVVRKQVGTALVEAGFTVVEAGFTVVEAQDGLDGLKKLGENQDVRLIICDVNMPEMDGITMCGKVSKMESFNKIPIFMLTTETNADLKQKGKDAGVKAWMVKPADMGKMIAAIKKVLGL